MKLTKNFLNEVLEEVVEEFNKKIIPIQNGVEINYIEKEEFMQNVKSDPLIKQQIQMGFYKDIDKEYPNFLVVYNQHKVPFLALMGIPYKVTVCLEKAKDIMKPYTKVEVRNYLKHAFAHEVAHLVQDQIIEKKEKLWEKCLKETHNNEALAKELLVENIADMLSDRNEYEEIQNKIWGLVMRRTDKIRKNLRR